MQEPFRESGSSASDLRNARIEERARLRSERIWLAAAEKLKDWPFRHKIAAPVVVVGHGRSPEEKGWGRRIDSAACVIRMWDCDWQKPKDYGSRYDIGFLEIGGVLVEKFQRHRNRGREPMQGWLASWLCGKPTHLPERTEVIFQGPWNELGKSLGGRGATGRLQFTRGTIAACWAIERCEPGSEVVLVGFDNIAVGKTLPLDEAFCAAYQANPGTFSFNGYDGGLTKQGNHDFAIERPVLEALATSHGVKVIFAQEAW